MRTKLDGDVSFHYEKALRIKSHSVCDNSAAQPDATRVLWFGRTGPAINFGVHPMRCDLQIGHVYLPQVKLDMNVAPEGDGLTTVHCWFES